MISFLEEKINRAIGNEWFRTKVSNTLSDKISYVNSCYPLAYSLANQYKDVNGKTRKELIITFSPETPLPRSTFASANNCFFRGDGEEATLKIPIFEEELKYFYSNYHDYYYLPTEDVALHKSVATFVDKEHRLPASAANCYTRKFSNYLPQWDTTFEPFFKRDYKSKELYFELTDELKKDRQAFADYTSHVLSMIASTY